ncbi:MAG: flagellar basal body-associated FliL family protein [Gammaproteobacteria bacterium]|nr:flagellar basal body-associated FliL family protein [Gammaproteobacteria bacterium]
MSFAVVSLLCVAALIGTSTPLAQESADVRYVPLQPAFIANFGVTEQGHLKYVKTEISIRVSTQDAEMAARYHLPALRNSLVLLLSRQDEVTVSTGSGREAILEEALVELRAILKAEEGQSYIDDIMFTNFVVQR